MDSREFANGMKQLQEAYPSMTMPGRELLEAWYESFKGFTQQDFIAGVRHCMERERYRPSLSVLRDHVFAAIRERKQSEAEADAMTGEVCPWCGGRGWFTQYEAKEHCGSYYDVCLPCQCAKSSNPAIGRENIAAATNDAKWYFDAKTYGFRRKRDFIKPEDPNPFQQAQLWNQAKQIGKRF